MKRIMIIGGAGSGKTTLALHLGQITELPVVHIDPMYWMPNWVQRPGHETVKLACEAAEQDTWIFEGNNSASLPQRLARADIVVFLDVGTLRRLWRILKRTFHFYGKTRPDMAEGCIERVDWGFLKFVASYYYTGRPKAFGVIDSLPQEKVRHIKNKQSLTKFLSEFD